MSTNEETIEPFDPGPDIRGRNVKLADSRTSIVHEINPYTNPTYAKITSEPWSLYVWSLGWSQCGELLSDKLCPTWTTEPVDCLECLAHLKTED